MMIDHISKEWLMHLKSKISYLLLVIIISTLSLHSQQFGMQQETKVFTIAGIEVSGNEYADSQTIIALSGLRPGDKIQYPPDFSDTRFQNALKNIWRRKQFSYVDIIIQKVVGDQLFLKIEVEEYPRLSFIKVENNDEIDDSDIIEKIGKTRGEIITKYDLYLAERAVEQLYSEEGMVFAKAEAELVADTAAYTVMEIYLEEGIEFGVNKIVIEGNENVEDDELIDAFEETKTKAWWQLWKSDDFDKDKYELDRELLLVQYKNLGYMDAEILRDTVIYDEEDESVDIVIEVYEGQQVYVRNVEFTGNTVFPDFALKERLEFEKGDPYNFEKFQRNLLGNEEQTDASSLYMDNGYLRASLMPEEKRISEDSVDIVVSVFENERYKVGKVTIKGNTKTKDKVIRRELFTRPGDYFSRSAIIRSIRQLNVLNYFNPEALNIPEIVPSQTDATAVDLVYSVEERSNDTFNASVGFAGSFGLTVAAGFTFNNFSLLEPLKGGGGQVFNFNWEFGQFTRFRTFSLGLTEPWLFNKPITVGFNIFDTYINHLSIQQQRTGASLNFGKRFNWPDDYWRGDWFARFQFNDISTNAAGSFWRPGEYTEFTLTQKFSRISINNMFFPTKGSNFSLSTSWAMGSVGVGETDFFKNVMEFEMYNPLFSFDGQDRLVWQIGTKMGYITSFENDSTLSPIELFRIGGNGLANIFTEPLRGYDDRTIGSNFGDKVMAKYYTELRFAVSLNPMPIYVYGFAEAGNVWQDLSKTDPFDLKRAAGLGIQLFVNPIGVIGFSYGYGFDPTNVDRDQSGWKFLFHLGQR
jgi:outer membrane protein insertion porin family